MVYIVPSILNIDREENASNHMKRYSWHECAGDIAYFSKVISACR